MQIDFQRARHAITVLLATVLVVACGGGSDSDGDSADVRFLNATIDVGALDMAVDDERQFADVAVDAVSGYAGIDAGSGKDVEFKRSEGDASVLDISSIEFSEGERYTVVAYGRDGSVALANLQEDADEPSSGNATLRVFNGATDAGSVDLYLTASGTDLESVSASVSGIAPGSVSTYAQKSRGTYRLRITGAGDTSDVRLDIAEVVLGNQARLTFVLQPSASGVMVSAVMLEQEGGATVLKNTQARLRLAASASGNGVVAMTVGGTSVNSGLTSPAVGSYVLVPSGSQGLNVQVNGMTVAGASPGIVAGTDYTALVYGPSAAVQLRLLTDDNRLPTADARAKLRLVHGAEGYDSLSLSLDAVSVAGDVGYGNASSFQSVRTNSGNALIEVTAATSNTPIYTTERSSGTTNISIDAKSVYTVFVLGGASTPRGILRKDR